MRDERSPRAPRVFVNEQSPPGLEAGPTRFVVGQLGPETSMQGVATYLIEHGIAEHRIHFLHGQDGIAFLDSVGNRFTRMLSDAQTDAKAQLTRGGVVVGVFDVPDEDVSATRTVLEESGILQSTYYGKWTNFP